MAADEVAGDPEVELISAMIAETSKKGFGPKSAHELAQAFGSIAGPIARLVAEDPTSGPDRVERAVDYVQTRTAAAYAKEVVKENEAEERRKAQAKNDKPKAVPDPPQESAPAAAKAG